MPSRKHLPTLLYLLEDESTTVRNTVLTALKAFGTDLERVAQPFLHLMHEDVWPVWKALIQEVKAEAIAESWLSWIHVPNDYEALEQALVNLAQLEFGQEAETIETQLEELVAAYQSWTDRRSAPHLMAFLFGNMDFQVIEGIERVPHHDNLLYVLNKRRGSDLLIGALALVLGHRLGISLHGIFIQGHFLLLHNRESDIALFNPRQRGAKMQRSSALYIEEAFRRNLLTSEELKAQVPEIVSEILQNHIMALQDQNARTKVRMYEQHLALLHELTAQGKGS